MGMPTGGGSSSSGSMTTSLVTFALVIGIFYFLIIRPQNKKQKDTKSMIEAVKKNDKVVTIGGIRGTVFSVKEETVIVKVDDECKLEFNKSAISTVLNVSPENKKDSKESKKVSKDSKEKK
ncbi:preprotein translocase subunit YajC [Oceanispirochaeta sp. M2]|nr:preprotein translocase subunit YajC [Oceanispirochaeta sp. M2]NPD73387.1 preprotein translocase subunit YajC [Oceanispirochaeta sp. M1]RDG30932.1 preprotein translocase subunit YajC [Oceanispirochaeta sp. M1]